MIPCRGLGAARTSRHPPRAVGVGRRGSSRRMLAEEHPWRAGLTTAGRMAWAHAIRKVIANRAYSARNEATASCPL